MKMTKIMLAFKVAALKKSVAPMRLFVELDALDARDAKWLAQQ